MTLYVEIQHRSRELSILYRIFFMKNGYKLYIYPRLSHIQMFRDTCMNTGRTFLNVELHSGSPFPHGSRRPLL